jgi:hypothetical protein
MLQNPAKIYLVNAIPHLEYFLFKVLNWLKTLSAHFLQLFSRASF